MVVAGGWETELALRLFQHDNQRRMTLLESTLEKLKSLPEEDLAAVHRYIDELHSPTAGGRFDDLLGCLTQDEANRLSDAIEESCERIETNCRSW